MPEKSVGDDAAAVREVLDGRLDAFGLLVRRHSRVACSVAFAHLGNRADAEDAVQEAFIQAYQGLGSLREPAKFAAWLLSIVRHVSINAAKRRSRTVPMAEKAGAMDDLRREIERRERERMVEDLLASLEEEEREIITMHYFAGMSTAEIAEALDVPRETVKKRLQRTRAALATPELVAACAPEREEEERIRKRVMAAVLLLPTPIQEIPKPDQRIPRAITGTMKAGSLNGGFRFASPTLQTVVKVAIALLAVTAVVGGVIWFMADRDLPRRAPSNGGVVQIGPTQSEPGGQASEQPQSKGITSGKASGKAIYQGK